MGSEEDQQLKKLLIWGAGDQGLVTLDCALAMNQYCEIDFLDIKEKGHRDILGYKLYEEEQVELESFLKLYDEVIVACGSNELRASKTAILLALNVKLACIVHPTAVISRFAKVSPGCTVLSHAVININARVGIGCIVNTHSAIEHDCIVEDYVNICPKVAMAGHVCIGERSFLGIGCSVIDQIKVGKNVIIGAGAVVISDVLDDTTVVGVPAKAIKKEKISAL